MYYNKITRNVDTALPQLCAHVMNGDEFDSRAGKTRDTTQVGITLTDPWEREIVNPARKHNIAAQIAETMWVLSGRDDIGWLGHYLPRAADFSDDGRVWRGAYGKRLRRWPTRDGSGDVIDQLAHVVSLLREDPNTRRAVMVIYDPDVDTADGKDIPCNNVLGFAIRRGQLDVNVTIRSNDLMWGWSGINAFEWSALQEIVAGLLGVKVGALHFSITSLHLYEQHWDRAHKIMSKGSDVSPPFPWRARFSPLQRSVDYLDLLLDLWFDIEDAIRLGRPRQVVDPRVDRFPEPMLRGWLRILQWWWSGNEVYLKPLDNTRLRESARVAVQPKHPNVRDAEKFVQRTAEHFRFVDYVKNLHSEKHAAYGDSWKRRGEMLGIMANIARKIDRLGANSSTADESAADTAIDLLVYLAKYRWWLVENSAAPTPVLEGTVLLRDPDVTNGQLEALSRDDFRQLSRPGAAALEEILTDLFSELEVAVEAKNPERYKIVQGMLPQAYALAYSRWIAEQK